MTEKIYRINARRTDEFQNFVRTHPNFVEDMDGSQGFRVVCDFPDQASQDSFEGMLKDKMFTVIDDKIDSAMIPPTDQLLYSVERPVTKNNLGDNYINVAPDFQGRPFLVDTTGFTKLAIHIFWDKNSGTGNHSLRIIDHSDDTKIIYETVVTQGQNLDANVNLIKYFRRFKGLLRTQVKSDNGGLDSPTFHALRIYLRR